MALLVAVGLLPGLRLHAHPTAEITAQAASRPGLQEVTSMLLQLALAHLHTARRRLLTRGHQPGVAVHHPTTLRHQGDMMISQHPMEAHLHLRHPRPHRDLLKSLLEQLMVRIRSRSRTADSMRRRRDMMLRHLLRARPLPRRMEVGMEPMLRRLQPVQAMVHGILTVMRSEASTVRVPNCRLTECFSGIGPCEAFAKPKRPEVA